jgi:hypothetical protein
LTLKEFLKISIVTIVTTGGFVEAGGLIEVSGRGFCSGTFMASRSARDGQSEGTAGGSNRQLLRRTATGMAAIVRNWRSELHWYGAANIGRRREKVKRDLENLR